jgi:hypothetical protein
LNHSTVTTNIEAISAIATARASLSLDSGQSQWFRN